MMRLYDRFTCAMGGVGPKVGGSVPDSRLRLRSSRSRKGSCSHVASSGIWPDSRQSLMDSRRSREGGVVGAV